MFFVGGGMQREVEEAEERKVQVTRAEAKKAAAGDRGWLQGYA